MIFDLLPCSGLRVEFYLVVLLLGFWFARVPAYVVTCLWFQICDHFWILDFGILFLVGFSWFCLVFTLVCLLVLYCV